jgi:hypothetical protein
MALSIPDLAMETGEIVGEVRGCSYLNLVLEPPLSSTGWV